MNITNLCAPTGSSCDTTPTYTANGGGDMLDYATSMKRPALRFAPNVGPNIAKGSPLPTCGRVNPQAGNLAVQFGTPAAGTLDATPLFTYNSGGSGGTAAGMNWTNTFLRSMTLVTGGGVQITTSEGMIFFYAKNFQTGGYTPPAGAQNSLTGNFGQPWTETQPDGLAYHYDATPTFKYIQLPSGGRWTIVGPGATPTGVLNPAGGRYTFAMTTAAISGA
jgi:hypothetical protein